MKPVPCLAFGLVLGGALAVPATFGEQRTGTVKPTADPAAPTAGLAVPGRHGVKLSEEELHRITLWLDALSVFYGVYEKEGGEAQLRGEIVRPTLE